MKKKLFIRGLEEKQQIRLLTKKEAEAARGGIGVSLLLPNGSEVALPDQVFCHPSGPNLEACPA